MKWTPVTGSRSLVISICSPLILLFMAAVVGLFAVISYSQPASALTTVPTRMNFQGRLTDSAGNIKPNGTYNMRLKLYTVASAGSPVWSEDRLVSASQGVTVTNGLFAIQLGSITSLPAGLFASGNLYLEVELPTPATATSASPTWIEGPMSPRNQLATSAYAYNAETLDGLDSSSFFQNTTSAQVGNLSIQGATNSSPILSITQGSSTGSLLQVGDGSTTGLVVANNGSISTYGSLMVKDTTVAAGSSLTVTGGITSTRPASPTEGMIYFDTTTKQLLTYSNGKWQADRSTATKIVAASNSSQAAKDAADYVADGENSVGSGTGTIDGDQIEINQALTAAAGGKVYLMEGTYTVDASISIPNNTTLAGAGRGTVIQLGNFGSTSTTINAMANSDTSTGTGVTIQDLKLDGRKSLNTAGTQKGISFQGMGGGSGASARQGAKLSNLLVLNFKDYGMHLVTSSNNILIGNTVQGNGNHGIYLNVGSNNTLTGNSAQGNVSAGFLINSDNSTVAGNAAQGNTYGYFLSSANNTTLTGNTTQGNSSNGIFLGSSNNNTVTGNTSADNGGSSFNGGIYLSNSNSNTISGNTITDTSATATNYAIDITNSGSNANYLAGNTLGSGSIRDLGTGTIFGGQVDASGNFVIQPAGNINLNKNTTVSAGTLTLGSTSQQGSLVVHDGNGQTATIRVADIAGNYTYTIPVTTGNDIFCMQTLANCGGVGSGVTTVGVLDGGVENANGATIIGNTIYLQSASPTSAGLMTTEAQSFTGEKTFGAQVIIQDTLTVQTELNVTPGALSTFAGDVFIINGASLNIWGGATSTRPLTPSDGMIYFDTTTKQLLAYANGKWQADRSDAIFVAASNSSQADKDAADYVANGDTAAANDGDQIQINQALTAAAGKKVVLLAGTYVADATILIPNNTTLTGVGQGTVIELADLDITENLIEFSDAFAPSGLVVRDLKISGRSDLNTAGTQHGIYDGGFGYSTGSGATTPLKIVNLFAERFRNSGVYLSQRLAYSSVLDSTFKLNGAKGLESYAPYATFSNNRAMANTSVGIQVHGLSSTVTGNVVDNNGTGYSIGASGITFANNEAYKNTTTGVDVITGSNVTVTGNVIDTSGFSGISIGNSTDGNIADNRILNSGGATANNAIYIANSDSFSITGNTITDTSATTTNYAININDATSDTNYLANNTLGGGSINDLGTGTIYANQLNSTGQLVNASTGGTVSKLQPSSSADLYQGQSSSGTSLFKVTSTGAIQGTSLDTIGATALALGGSNATAINLNQNTTVLAGKTLTVGTISNGIIFSDTGITLAGTARGSKKVTLSPEFAGATFTGDGTNNNGTLTSDFCSPSGLLNINASMCTDNDGVPKAHSYYSWTSPGTAVDYDIYVKYQIPSDYSTGSMTNLTGWAHSTGFTVTNATISMYKENSSTVCATLSNIAQGSGQWYSMVSASPLGSCTIAANDKVVFKIRVQSDTGGTVSVGDISFQYRSAF